MSNEFGEVVIEDLSVMDTNADDLAKVKMLTSMMREHQSSVVRLGKQRRTIIQRLRSRRVPYRQIADACGVTDQALYADLRKHRDEMDSE